MDKRQEEGEEGEKEVCQAGNKMPGTHTAAAPTTWQQHYERGGTWA